MKRSDNISLAIAVAVTALYGGGIIAGTVPYTHEATAAVGALVAAILEDTYYDLKADDAIVLVEHIGSVADDKSHAFAETPDDDDET